MKFFSSTKRDFLISVLVCAIDQGIKAGIRRFPIHAVLFSVPGFFEITHYANTGAAFGVFSGHTLLIAIFSSALLFAMLTYFLRSMHLVPGARTAIAFLIGGGMGNLLDRLIRGEVTDYILLRFVSFPVFNFADICITLSVFVLAIYILSGRLDEHPDEAHGSDH